MNKLFKKLISVSSPSGMEDNIREIIKAEAKDFAEEISTDVMGNLIVHKKGNGKKMMLCAHMDEIGVMATAFDDNGYVRIAPLGGLSLLSMIGKHMVFENGVDGVVWYEENVDKKDLKLKNLFIDIGAKNKKSAERKLKVGMTATYAPSYANLSGRVSAKSLDDRAGCYILLEVLKRCKSQNDLYFVFTVQEELGLRGAKTAAYELKPDLAIAVDVTDTGDVPGGTKMSIELGKGPAIKIKDNSVITHRKARDLLISSATENNIPYQLEILEAGGTDAGAIHTTGSGIVTGAVSIPCRYIHSNVETADGKDIENAIKLLNFTVEKEL